MVFRFSSKLNKLNKFLRLTMELNFAERIQATEEASTASRYFSKGFLCSTLKYSLITIFLAGSLLVSRAKYAYLSTPAENGFEEILKVKPSEKRFDFSKWFESLSSFRVL